MSTRIVISSENPKAMEFIEKMKARKQEVKAILSKGLILAKNVKK